MSNLNNKEVLIFSGNSVIGMKLAKKFCQNNWNVDTILRSKTLGKNRKLYRNIYEVTEFKKDIILPILNNKKYDYFVLASGSPTVRHFRHNSLGDYEANVMTIVNAAQAIYETNPNSEILYLSSAAVYGSRNVPSLEWHKPTPISVYGKTKLMAENFLLNRVSQTGVKINIFRIFSVYGTGMQKQLIWDIVKKLKSNNNIFFGTGKEVRDFIHIEDAVNLINIILKSDVNRNQVFNVGTGVGRKVEDVVNLVKNLVAPKSHVIFNNDKEQESPDYQVADMNKAFKLGWKPKKDFNEGVVDYVAWINQNTK